MLNTNERIVRIINPLQASKYIKHGVQPLELRHDSKTGLIVFVFSVKETRELYTKWLNREL